jgi:hypothetical protein
MVRGEEAVATADEKMGEAEGGRGRRRARRRSASGGRGCPRTTAPTTPSRGGEPSLDLTGGRDDPPGGATGEREYFGTLPPPTLMLFFLPLAPTQLFAGLCFFASVSVGVAAFLFAITPPYLGCRGRWRLRHCRCRLRRRWRRWQRRRQQQRTQGCSGWL